MSPPRDCAPALRQAGLAEMADWAEERPIRHGWKGRTCRELWDSAPRGDWLLYWAERAGADRRDLVRAAAACVRPALQFIKEAAHRWWNDPTGPDRRRDLGAQQASFVPSAVRRSRSASFAAMEACVGVRHATVAAGGSDADADAARAHAHASCADAVRHLLPFLDLSAMGRG